MSLKGPESTENEFLRRKFVDAFIDHPKLLVGLVQGPCIGIACTTMGLYDVVYASDAVIICLYRTTSFLVLWYPSNISSMDLLYYRHIFIPLSLVLD